MNKYRELFCAEAEDQLAALSRTLLLLEKNPEQATLYAELMRCAHTVKGASATMGFVHMAELAHALEDVFQAGQGSLVVIDQGIISLALRTVDRLSFILGEIKEGKTDSPSDELMELLHKAVGKGGVAASLSIIEQQKADASLRITEEEQIAARIVTPTSIKVGVDHLDVLTGLFEEMLILRLKLVAKLAPSAEIVSDIGDPLLRKKLSFLNDFKSLFDEMARMLSETQDQLLRIRLVPLEQIFGQYPRMMRDLAVKENKEVEFAIEGSDIELDRAVMGGLGGALTHLLRNAIDHGIAKKGKVLLRAERDKGRARVIVEDSGEGVHIARVREVAISRGVEKREIVEAMNDQEVLELLFHPNMSTNTEVTTISGRGVGLFAVKAFAADVGGHLSIVSPIPESGVGTRFTLDLPISLATIKVLVVESRGYTFAIPFGSVVRTVFVASPHIMGAAHQETIYIEDRLFPLVRLDELLKLALPGDRAKLDEGSPISLVILTLEKGPVALLVDEVHGEEELVVKSLPPLLRKIKGFAGSTLLPDGRTVLLLDAPGLLLHAINDILESTHP